MNNLQINVAGRVARLANSPLAIVEDTVGFDTLTATFDDEWNGLTIVANFANGCRAVSVEYEDGMYIPWEAKQDDGFLMISFAGYTNGVEILRTKTMEPITVAPSCPKSGVPETPATKDIVAQAIEAADNANAAADAIDDMTASAHSLPEGSAPTAELDRESYPWNLSIGIPNFEPITVRDVTVNGQSVVEDGVAALEVDEALSEYSANPVANAAVSQQLMNVAVNADETLVFWRGLVTV